MKDAYVRDLEKRVAELERERGEYPGQIISYHDLFERSADAVLVLNNRNLVDCNQAAVDALEYPDKTSLLRRSIVSLSPPVQPDGRNSREKADAMLNIASDRGSHRFEWVHLKADGSEVDMEVLLTTVSRKHNQEIIHITLRDVSERRIARQTIRKSEERFRSLLESTNDFIWEVDPEGRYSYVSPQIRDVLGYEPEEVIGKTPFDLMPEKEALNLRDQFFETLGKRERIVNLENVNLSKQGNSVVLETSGAPFYTMDGELAGYRGIDRDISNRKIYEEQLVLTESVFRNTVEGIAITDREGRIQRINSSFTKITGYTEEEALGSFTRLLKSDRHDDDFYRHMWKELLNKGVWNGEIWNRRKDGSAYPEWLSISAIYDDEGQIKNFISVFHDISEKKSNEEKLEFLAFHDPLTRLPNRHLFYDRLEVALEASRRQGDMLALLYMDVDNFKDVNDTHGHPFGDELLCGIRDRINSLIRRSDTFSRYGGDEFTIILNGIDDEKDVLDFSDRLLDLFRTPLLIGGEEIFTSLSMGMALYPLDGEDVITLEKNADMALYQAKKEGKHRAYLYHRRLNKELVRKNYLLQGLRNSIESFDSFEIVYQPKVDVEARDIQGVESLIRWNYQGEAVSPAEFIPLAEKSNLILPLGYRILEQALKDMGEINAGRERELLLSVNLSSRQFNDEKLIATIESKLKESRFNRENLIFEITETTSVSNLERAVTIMNQISGKGIQMSLDDFGTGYSSLSYLKKFPLKELKIDRSFVQDLPQDSNDSAICETIISMARTLNFKVVAEGVENTGQLRFLRDKGCSIIQGYYFFKPLCLSELKKVLSGPYRRHISDKTR